MSLFRNRRRNRIYRHDLKGLELRMRAKLRTQRRKQLALRVALIGAVAGLVSWGLWLGCKAVGRRLFLENPAYQITEIRVETTGDVLRKDQVVAYLKLRPGQNLLAADLGALRTELELLPLVERAEVARQLPGSLVVRITERTPLANISSKPGSKRYQIDRHGVVMDLLSSGTTSTALLKRVALLPEITGAKTTDLKIGRQIASVEVFHALLLIQKLEQLQSGPELEIDSIDVSRRALLLAATTEGVKVKIGLAEMDRQLRRLAFVLQDARQRHERLATVDLSVGQDVPVTFASHP